MGFVSFRQSVCHLDEGEIAGVTITQDNTSHVISIIIIIIIIIIISGDDDNDIVTFERKAIDDTIV